MSKAQPLKDFVVDVTRLIDGGVTDDELPEQVAGRMKQLVSANDWLPAEFIQAGDSSYNQYLLYCDPLERFSLVSFVWGPQQRTPIHDHTVWGVIGQYRGSEMSQHYRRTSYGGLKSVGEPVIMHAGDVARVSPPDDDIHLVCNPSKSELAISIHTYGANIGCLERSVYDLETGKESVFVSSYTNTFLPNIWR